MTAAFAAIDGNLRALNRAAIAAPSLHPQAENEPSLAFSNTLAHSVERVQSITYTERIHHNAIAATPESTEAMNAETRAAPSSSSPLSPTRYEYVDAYHVVSSARA